MIQHVVLMSFKPEVQKMEIILLEENLMRLRNIIQDKSAYKFGRNIIESERAFDFGLVSSFTDLNSLEKYQMHPEHKKVLKIVQSMCKRIVSVDFPIDT